MVRNISLAAAKILAIIIVLWWSFFVIMSHGFSLISLIESIIPLVLLGTSIIAWHFNRLGGVIFIFWGLAYVAFAWSTMQFMTYVFVSGPLILCGLLFVLAGSLSEK